jgi:hypothetical protein
MKTSGTYPLRRSSSETVSFFLPWARRLASTLRPLAVAILERKPCLLALFLFEGWNVLFIGMYVLSFFPSFFGSQKYELFLKIQTRDAFF